MKALMLVTVTRLNPSKEGSNRYSKDHFGSTIPDEFNEQPADATLFTSEEKVSEEI